MRPTALSFLYAGMISRLLGDPIYEAYARRAMKALWDNRHNETGLFGNVMDINTGKWISEVRERN